MRMKFGAAVVTIAMTILVGGASLPASAATVPSRESYHVQVSASAIRDANATAAHTLIAAAVTVTPAALVTPAYAIPAPISATSASATLATISTKTVTSQDCLTQVTAAVAAGYTDLSTDVCTSTVTLEATAATPVTSADLAQAKLSMSAADYSSLATAAAAGAIQHKSFNQQMNNITDSETQRGTFYYDGSHAWVSVRYRNAVGVHDCVVDWAGGYVVESKRCDEYGTIDTRYLQAQWHFSVIPSGGLVNWDEVYTMRVTANGTIAQ